MNRLTKTLGLMLTMITVSHSALAQSAPDSLFACLDRNGNLYGVTPIGKLGEGCSPGDLAVNLGSAGEVNASNGLLGNLSNGVVDIGVADGLAITPSCPPGNLAVSGENGGWVCTEPGRLARRANIGSTIWVVPSFVMARNPANLDDELIIRTAVAFVNPGRNVTKIQAKAFNEDGMPVALSDPIKDIPAQGRRVYRANRETAWMMAVSCSRVLATAFDRIGQLAGSGGFQIEAYAVDCTDADKDEYICQTARTITLTNCLLPGPPQN